jgi:hypothetical protein
MGLSCWPRHQIARSSVAAAGLFSCPSSDHLNGHRKPKRHETVWRAVASRKGGWNNRRRNLAPVPEILPGAVRLNDKRSAAGRICASNTGSCGYASADAIGFTVSVAAASNSAGWGRRVDRRRISVGAGSSISFPESTVVWVNERSHIYHFPGTRDYGHTKSGSYMCEAEAQTSGNRTAMNESAIHRVRSIRCSTLPW